MSQTNQKKHHILIVEDDPQMIRLLSMYLKKSDYDVSVAYNGEEALNSLKQLIPDLIVSDIMMPGMDGLVFRQNLLQNPEHRIIPFMFLSARGKVEEKITGLRLSVDDYMVKPFDMKELLARIEAILSRHTLYTDMIKYDSLTNLLNRKTILDELEREFKRVTRYNTPLSIAVIDVDHFKKCNDTYGHSYGDYVLIKIADTLLSQVRETDFAGRYGGEEFIILMTDTDKDSAALVAERLRKSVAELDFDKPGFTTSISVGVATGPLDALTYQDLIKNADVAMYSAKKNGRNKVKIFLKTMQNE